VSFAIAGLGNPGSQYVKNRHNIGFLVVERLAEMFGASFQEKKKWDAQQAEVIIDNKKVVLLKPQTFMNLSGRALLHCSRSNGVATENWLVVHDELDLPFGRIQLKEGGGTAGHNGLKSIVASIGKGFTRLRFGVGKPLNPMQDTSSWVLSNFSALERETLDNLIDQSAKAAIDCLTLGLKDTQNKVNRK